MRAAPILMLLSVALIVPGFTVAPGAVYARCEGTAPAETACVSYGTFDSTLNTFTIHLASPCGPGNVPMGAAASLGWVTNFAARYYEDQDSNAATWCMQDPQPFTGEIRTVIEQASPTTSCNGRNRATYDFVASVGVRTASSTYGRFCLGTQYRLSVTISDLTLPNGASLPAEGTWLVYVTQAEALDPLLCDPPGPFPQPLPLNC